MFQNAKKTSQINRRGRRWLVVFLKGPVRFLFVLSEERYEKDHIKLPNSEYEWSVF